MLSRPLVATTCPHPLETLAMFSFSGGELAWEPDENGVITVRTVKTSAAKGARPSSVHERHDGGGGGSGGGSGSGGGFVGPQMRGYRNVVRVGHSQSPTQYSGERETDALPQNVGPSRQYPPNVTTEGVPGVRVPQGAAMTPPSSRPATSEFMQPSPVYLGHHHNHRVCGNEYCGRFPPSVTETPPDSPQSQMNCQSCPARNCSCASPSSPFPVRRRSTNADRSPPPPPHSGSPVGRKRAAMTRQVAMMSMGTEGTPDPEIAPPGAVVGELEMDLVQPDTSK